MVFPKILHQPEKNSTNWLVLLARLFATLIQVVGDKNGLILVPSGFVGNTFQLGKSPLFVQTETEQRVEVAEPRAGSLLRSAAQEMETLVDCSVINPSRVRHRREVFVNECSDP